jgi:hypothetical protein
VLKEAIAAEAMLPALSLIYVPGAPGTVPNEKVAIFIESSLYFAPVLAEEIPAVVPAGQGFSCRL